MSRPTTTPCYLCRGSIDVAPKGRIPNAHPSCQTVQETLTRLDRALESAAAALTARELVALRSHCASTFQQVLNLHTNRALGVVSAIARKR